MNKQQFDHLLLDYVEGTLSSQEREQVDVYLASSVEAMQDATELQKSIRLVRSHISLLEPPASMDQAILQAARQAVSSPVVSMDAELSQRDSASWGTWGWMRWFSSPSFKPILAFCTVVLMVGSAFLITRQQKLGSLAESDKTYQQQPPSNTISPGKSASTSSAPTQEKKVPSALGQSEPRPAPEASALRQEPSAPTHRPVPRPIVREETVPPSRSQAADTLRKQESKKVSDIPVVPEPSVRFAQPPPPMRSSGSAWATGSSRNQGGYGTRKPIPPPAPQNHPSDDDDKNDVEDPSTPDPKPKRRFKRKVSQRRRYRARPVRRSAPSKTSKNTYVQRDDLRPTQVISKRPMDSASRGTSGKKAEPQKGQSNFYQRENEDMRAKRFREQDNGSPGGGMLPKMPVAPVAPVTAAPKTQGTVGSVREGYKDYSNRSDKEYDKRAITRYKAALLVAQKKRNIPQMRNLHLVLIRLLLKNKDTRAAMSYQKQFFATFPTSQQHRAHAHIAPIYQELGDLQNYRFHRQRSQPNPSDP